MLKFDERDRDKFAPSDFQNLYTYTATVISDNTKVIKIGSNNQSSVRGRLAWNKFYNEGYHLFGFRGKLYDDEKDRIKITEAVNIQEIYKESLVKTTSKDIKRLENELRKHLTPYEFPTEIKFSGKTEFVEANESSYNIIDKFFKFLKDNYECK